MRVILETQLAEHIFVRTGIYDGSEPDEARSMIYRTSCLVADQEVFPRVYVLHFSDAADRHLEYVVEMKALIDETTKAIEKAKK